jgi:hypothetical protein
MHSKCSEDRGIAGQARVGRKIRNAHEYPRNSKDVEYEGKSPVMRGLTEKIGAQQEKRTHNEQ